MGIRLNRIEDVLLRAIGDVLMNKVRDPRVGFVTVTGVAVTPDIRCAKVFVSVIGGDKEKRDTLEGLKASAPYIRREVAHQVVLKTMPELTFYYDESVEKGERIMNLLKDIESDTKLG
jgi:ribosome-binding factor A